MAAVKREIRRDVSLVRALSKLGYTSRSRAAGLVEQGLVKVNGRVMRDPSFRCSLSHDRISVDEHRLKKPDFLYIMMNKPAGIVTTRSDEKGRRTVYDILGEIGQWVFPVGRLDKETSGLLLFTNDTQFGEKITNPASKIEKTYRVVMDAGIRDEDLEQFRRGMQITEERFLPAKVKRIGPSEFEMTIREGKNRQVRRMCEALGYEVVKLQRIALGRYLIGDLKEGEWKKIGKEEIVQVN